MINVKPLQAIWVTLYSLIGGAILFVALSVGKQARKEARKKGRVKDDK